MPRNFTKLQQVELYAEESGVPLLYLVEIEHEDLPADPEAGLLAGVRRFVRDTVNYQRFGETWYAADFQIKLPNEDPESISSATIAFQNIERDLLDAFTDPPLLTPPTVRVWITAKIDADDDPPIAGPAEYAWREISWDLTLIKGSLEPDDTLNEQCPKDEVNPSNFPGVFT